MSKFKAPKIEGRKFPKVMNAPIRKFGKKKTIPYGLGMSSPDAYKRREEGCTLSIFVGRKALDKTTRCIEEIDKFIYDKKNRKETFRVLVLCYDKKDYIKSYLKPYAKSFKGGEKKIKIFKDEVLVIDYADITDKDKLWNLIGSFRDGMLVIDNLMNETSIRFEGLCRNTKIRNLKVIRCFASFMSVLPKIWQNADLVYLFDTLDDRMEKQKIKNMLTNEREIVELARVYLNYMKEGAWENKNGINVTRNYVMINRESKRFYVTHQEAFFHACWDYAMLGLNTQYPTAVKELGERLVRLSQYSVLS